MFFCSVGYRTWQDNYFTLLNSNDHYGINTTYRIVCVFFPFILDFNGRTSRGHTEEEGNTGFSIHLLSAVLALIFLPFILEIKFVGRTSRGHTGGRSHRISHPPSFCGACLNFSREKDSAFPFPRRPWSRILCTTNDLIVLHPLGNF